MDCPDRIIIILTHDEISQTIEKITDKDIQREVKFDYENASEYIVEWSRYNLRATRQDAEEKSIISQMDRNEAFCMFDWGQKFLPQEYREAQSTYFGKRGMLVHICQTWKLNSIEKVPFNWNKCSIEVTSIQLFKWVQLKSLQFNF